MSAAYDLYQQGWSHLRDGMPAQATVALEKAKRLAVGRFAQRGKDNLVLVRPYKKGLILHECYYADEVRFSR